MWVRVCRTTVQQCASLFPINLYLQQCVEDEDFCGDQWAVSLVIGVSLGGMWVLQCIEVKLRVIMTHSGGQLNVSNLYYYSIILYYIVL